MQQHKKQKSNFSKKQSKGKKYNNLQKILQTQGPLEYHGIPVAPTWNGVQPFQIQRVKLKYSMRASVSTSLGAPAQQVFRINSFYDPDYTYTGHQPNYYSFWINMYQYYQVESIQLTSVVTNESDVPLYVTVLPMPLSTFPTSNEDNLEESPFARTVTCDPVGSNVTKTITLKLNLSKYASLLQTGTGNSIEYVQNQRTATNQNPTFTMFAGLNITPGDGSSVTMNVSYKCTLLMTGTLSGLVPNYASITKIPHPISTNVESSDTPIKQFDLQKSLKQFDTGSVACDNGA